MSQVLHRAVSPDWSPCGVTKSLSHAQMGLNSKFPTSIPVCFIWGPPRWGCFVILKTPADVLEWTENVLERFSFECCETKTKVITLANHIGVVALHESTASPSQLRVTSQPRVNHESSRIFLFCREKKNWS